MKLISRLLLLLLISTLWACNDDDIPKKTTPELSVTPFNLNFQSDGGTKKLNITSNTTWEISSDASWCTSAVQSGKENADVTITTEANTLEEERTARLTIVAEDYIGTTITVTQEAK